MVLRIDLLDEGQVWRMRSGSDTRMHCKDVFRRKTDISDRLLSSGPTGTRTSQQNDEEGWFEREEGGHSNQPSTLID